MKSSRTTAAATTTDVDGTAESLTVGNKSGGVRQRRATIPLSSRRCAFRYTLFTRCNRLSNLQFNRFDLRASTTVQWRIQRGSLCSNELLSRVPPIIV